MIAGYGALWSANRGNARGGYPLRQAFWTGLWALLLLGTGGGIVPAFAAPLACDDGIKTAFHPDADTTVIAVRLVKKGEGLAAQDVPKPPIIAAADLCLVKLMVGPGVTAEKDSTAR